MGAVSDPDDFQPFPVEETPQQVAAARHTLERQLGESLPPWPNEVSVHEDAATDLDGC